jgi:hypothetical protein
MPYLSGFNPSGGTFFCIFRFLVIILRIDVLLSPFQKLADLTRASVKRVDATPHAPHIVLTPLQRRAEHCLSKSLSLFANYPMNVTFKKMPVFFSQSDS